MSDASASTYGGARYIHGPMGEALPRTHTFTDAQLAEHDREVRAPLQELIEEARETLTASSVPLGMTEAQFYRNLVHLAWGILSRDVSDDAAPGGAQ